MLLQFLVVLIEFSKLVGQDVSVWDKIEMLFSISFLHPNAIEAKTIFSGDLMTLGEMIDLLVLIETLVQITLARGRRP